MLQNSIQVKDLYCIDPVIEDQLDEAYEECWDNTTRWSKETGIRAIPSLLEIVEEVFSRVLLIGIDQEIEFHSYNESYKQFGFEDVEDFFEAAFDGSINHQEFDPYVPPHDDVVQDVYKWLNLKQVLYRDDDRVFHIPIVEVW